MPFDYEANISAITNAFTGTSSYNTTTANPDLSSGLTTRVRNVYRTDPSIVDMRAHIYPAIFVRVNGKKEEFAGLGATGPTQARKLAVVHYDVIGFYMKDGASSSQQNVMLELERLAENMEGVLQAEYTLSGTAMWCQPVSTDFYGPFQTGQMWIKAVVMDVEAHYHFR